MTNSSTCAPRYTCLLKDKGAVTDTETETKTETETEMESEMETETDSGPGGMCD